MTTSGQYTYELNTRDFIKNAFIEAGVVDDHDSMEGEMYSWGLTRLNVITKSNMAKGLDLWRTKDLILFLEKDKQEYDLSTSIAVDSFTTGIMPITAQTISAPWALSAPYVDAGFPLAVGSYVGVTLEDGSLWWSTVDSFESGAGSTPLVVDEPPYTDIPANTEVFMCSPRAPKPLRIWSAYIVCDNDDTSHIPINVIPRSEYQMHSDKVSSSRPTEIYFRPDVNTSYLKVRPLADDTLQRIVMSAEYTVDDLIEPTDTILLPNWWYDALHLQLSYAVARSYNAPSGKLRTLKQDYMMAVEEAEGFNVENTYAEFTPEYTWP